MSIVEIEQRINEQAAAEAGKIKAESERVITELVKMHNLKKEEDRIELLEEARRRAEEVKRSHLVPARLKAKKGLLEEKQKIISGIYREIKKEKKLSESEVARLRDETEVKAAAILFEE